MSTPYIYVTGATGFVGSALCSHLLQQGYYVRASYRTLNPYLQKLQTTYPNHLQLIEYDLTSLNQPVQFWETLLKNVQSIVHSAAIVKDWGNIKDFQLVNVKATQNLSQKAQEYGVKQFIYISSIAVHGDCYPLEQCTEEQPYRPPLTNYAKTKKQGEKEVLALNCNEFRTLSLRPSNVYGPNDTTVTFPLFTAMEEGKILYINRGKAENPMIYIADLLQAITLCITKWDNISIHGQSYNITSENHVNWYNYLQYAAKLLNCPPPKISVPYFFAYFVASCFEVIAKMLFLREAPLLTRYRIAAVGCTKTFIIDKAKRMLGYQPQWNGEDGYQRGLTLSVDSYHKHKAK